MDPTSPLVPLPGAISPGAVALLLLMLAPLLAGCTGGQQALITSQRQSIDSLHTENDALRATLQTVRDSLRFLDDIDSGQYYRDRRNLIDSIDALNYALAVSRDGGNTVATLSVDELFNPASADLSNQGRQRLDAIAERLQEEHPGHTFRVEGHSDNVPIGPTLIDQYPTNWELSTARASAVVRCLIEAHDIAPDQLMAVGFGASRPIATNETAAGRRHNRRIRIAVLPEEQTR